ncbi:MAG TPA: chromosome partitioning protein, partial [Sphingomonas sp.]|nr:chromosome partitioning protein [Sphingomonas sp.]
MKKPSLLERAAEIYDFNAHARARGAVPAEALAAEIASVDPWIDAQPLPDTIPAEFLAQPDDAQSAAIGAPFLPPVGAPAAIDRMMLAERGMIVPGAPVGPLAEEFRLVKRQLLITRERIAESDS